MINPDCDINRWCVEPSSYIENADNYYTKHEVDEKIKEQSGSSITEEVVDEKISAATDDMATKTWVGEQGYLTEHQSLSGYATEQWVGEQGYLTEHQSLSAYSTTDEVNNLISASTDGMATEQWVEDKHYITGVDLSNYATLQDIPTVPTSNSAFTNDAGYALSADVTTALSGKQDTLTAGTNISISNNVISAKEYTAGNGIQITSSGTAKKISSNLPITAATDEHGYKFNIIGNSSSNTTYRSCAAAFGYGTETKNTDEFAVGKHNKSYTLGGMWGDDTKASGNTVFSVGIGDSDNIRKNAIDVRMNGDIYIVSCQTTVMLQDVLKDLQDQIDALRNGQ